ncbi:MAG: 5-methyltetrahydropteroyltriglutamate--homocysteine S-methyltransferase [Candidatus Omnitrophica bacterium]|nr:5-methyltetrahydropteroyltriglutamate--homocysteine S-methyltransferase [Candidatus Omnitrophota bacterium]MDD5671042.1 5-methyltetrahydropteroyltriglutamate--homocysteine S-methyltransferase [Candidatus Omnitrophota bacterium]
MAIASNLGFPRIGAKREIKMAVEAYWAGKISQETLFENALAVKRQNWFLQRDTGIQHIPSNDFSLYDHVLDMIALVGAVPARYGWRGDQVDLETYFAMARGMQGRARGGGSVDLPAMEMTKWFDTNYHYIVPEFEPAQKFRIASEKPFKEFQEALSLGIKTRPVLLGPVSFLKLGKPKGMFFDTLDLLPDLLEVYEEIIIRLVTQGAEWIQWDEPFLVMDPDEAIRKACKTAYSYLRKVSVRNKMLVATYFGGIDGNWNWVKDLPIDALHIDFVRAPGSLKVLFSDFPGALMLSAGLIDGRNIWKNDFTKSIAMLREIRAEIGDDRLMIAPSCSLLHVPADLDLEEKLDDELKGWLAFAKQKLNEVHTLTEVVNQGEDAVLDELAANQRALKSRKGSPRIHQPEVKARLKSVRPEDVKRQSPYAVRAEKQRGKLRLPVLPTTTIGSFPQTSGIRSARRLLRDGQISQADYDQKMREDIQHAIAKQEELGLDVLVHGEPERNDMVEYFGEHFSGFAFTQAGWVQSYGSRCVKPPILFGDVARPGPITVDWITFAQSLTRKPVKGMLTGPVTILEWSFVRDDQPRSETAKQIALAVRDEVLDLEKAGIAVIQIDEPAFREILPLARHEWPACLEWATECFRLATSGVRDETQIHTHMCYAEFHDILDAIARMDADVITLEASRSDMELLQVFKKFRYPNEIGPGVYDIHSPRVPSKEEIIGRLEKVVTVLPPQRVWVNPDCGLKTRDWKETELSLKNMVQAAHELRCKFADK